MIIFFLAETHHQSRANVNQILRIESKEEEVYKFNNAKGHAVKNTGNTSRVHLIIYWVETPIYNINNNIDTETNIVRLEPKLICGIDT